MTDVFFRNTLTEKLEAFHPIEPGLVRIYTCGPTVYRRQHVGNLRTYVFSDLLRRALEHFGYDVRHVINVTDVGHLSDDADRGEDKLERAAAETGQDARAIVDRVFAEFRTDLRRLNALEPHVYCKATEHIADQIALIRKLEARGFTYALDDGIYFETNRDPHYGAFRSLEADRDHTRIEAAGLKRNPADFALWKRSPPTGPRRQLEWPSPWGTGFPGWHIECSAMAIRYLGERIDLHTGGVDHVAVHHTNEIAQSENALGVRPWVNTWLHAGWLLLDGEKIAKRAGVAPSLDDLTAWGIPPDAFRYYLLTAHYRSALSLDRGGLDAAKKAWQRLGALVAKTAEPDATASTARGRELQRAFDAALGRDLDAPQALAVVWRAYRDPELSEGERTSLVRRLTRTLGLTLSSEPVLAANLSASEHASIEALVRQREQARVARDFVRADALRAELALRGVTVIDSPSGPVWKRLS